MTIGGSYNKGNGSGNGGNGRSGGRSYGLMLLIAFGAALLGVMILHKLRERRIFNLLITEKDNELFSLHLLLQKERDYIKEVKSKNEEMKSKIFSLRNQKMELDRRLLEMQSTIDSLKDEQKTMEIAIEEKQNEIKMLKVQDQMGNEMESPQVTALVENLKHKEAEIEDLKHRLQYPDKVPSKSQVNNITEADQNLERRNGEAASDGDENGNKAERENPANKSEDSKQENVSLSLGVANSTGVVSDQNIVGKDMESEEFKVKGNGQLGKNGISQGQGEGEENPGTTAKGGMELEIQGGFEKNDKRGSVTNKIKAKRWRLIAKNRRLENNEKLSGVTRLRSVRFYEDDHGELKSRVKTAAPKGGVLLVADNIQFEGRKAEDSPPELTKKGKVSQESGRKHGDEDGDGISNEDYKEEIDESEF